MHLQQHLYFPESKQDVAKDVFNELRGEMEKYGFEIIDTLIVDVQPDRKIRDSMNEINANKRLRQAATFKSEVIYIELQNSIAHYVAQYFAKVWIFS